MSIMREKCKRCGHAFSFHSRGAGKQCRAVGCKKGARKAPCPSFVTPPDATPDLKRALRESRKALST